MSSILTCLDKLPNRQECTVLIVGDEGTGKHDIGLAMLNQQLSFSLEVRTAVSLPLPKDKESSRPRIDFVIFVVNLTQLESLRVVEDALHKIDVLYFIGRACLVITGDDSIKEKIVDMEAMMQLADSYDLPLVFGGMQNTAALAQLGSRLTNMAQTASGFSGTVSPMLIDATRNTFTADL